MIKTATMREEYQTLIINLDYAGRCAGACPVCALSAEERTSSRVFLNPITIDRGFAEIARAGQTHVQNFVLGIGRGNMLDLGEDIAPKLSKIAENASHYFDYDHGLVEISTSLMGKIDQQIERAEHIMEYFQSADHGLDPRFVVVANAANISERYWAHLKQFFDHMTALRGHGDGSGDILLLNLSLGDLPDIDTIMNYIGHYKFPVNVSWAPMLDPAADKPETYNQLEQWLTYWYDNVLERGMDGSLVARIEDGMSHQAEDINGIHEQLKGHGSMLYFMAQDGSVHYGFSSVSADMDPIRFASGVSASTTKTMVREPSEEIAELMRWPACRGCEYVNACVTSGAYKSALLSSQRLAPFKTLYGKEVCLSGLRSAFGLYHERFTQQ